MLVPRLALVIAVTSASPLIIERMSDEPGDYRFRSGAEAPKMHMEPVTHEEYHGILRRSDDLTHLHAKDEGELMYISNLEDHPVENNDGSLKDELERHVLEAHMTVMSTNDIKILFMEQFEHMTSSIECNDEDGEVSMTFIADEIANYAKKQWEWVNGCDTREFLMVTNHPHCGKIAERAPYRIFNMTFVNQTVYIKAEATEWKKSVGNFKLNFKKSEVDHIALKRIKKRQIEKRDMHAKYNEEIIRRKKAKRDLAAEGGGLMDSIQTFFHNTGEHIGHAGHAAKAKLHDFIPTAQKAVNATGHAANKAIVVAAKTAQQVGKATIGTARTVGEFMKNSTNNLMTDPRHFDQNLNKTWSFNVGHPGRVTIFTDPLHEFERVVCDCINCFIRGAFDFTASIHVVNFTDFKEFSYSVDPRGLHARVEFNTKIITPIDSMGWDWNPYTKLRRPGLGEKPDPSKGIGFSQSIMTIPLFALYLPGLYTFGPVLNFEVGMAYGPSVITNFTIGGEIRVPDSAILKVDLANKKKSRASGFSGTTFTRIGLSLHEAYGSFAFLAYATPILSIGVNVLDIAGFETSIRFRFPQALTFAQFAYAESGACVQEFGASRTGLKVRTDLSLEIWLVIGEDKRVGDMDWFDCRLWEYRYVIFDECFPFQLDGFKVATGLPGADPGKGPPVSPTTISHGPHWTSNHHGGSHRSGGFRSGGGRGR